MSENDHRDHTGRGSGEDFESGLDYGAFAEDGEAFPEDRPDAAPAPANAHRGPDSGQGLAQGSAHDPARERREREDLAEDDLAADDEDMVFEQRPEPVVEPAAEEPVQSSVDGGPGADEEFDEDAPVFDEAPEPAVQPVDGRTDEMTDPGETTVRPAPVPGSAAAGAETEDQATRPISRSEAGAGDGETRELSDVAEQTRAGDAGADPGADSGAEVATAPGSRAVDAAETSEEEAAQHQVADYPVEHDAEEHSASGSAALGSTALGTDGVAGGAAVAGAAGAAGARRRDDHVDDHTDGTAHGTAHSHGGAAHTDAVHTPAAHPSGQEITDQDLDEEVRKDRRGASRFLQVLLAIFVPLLLIIGAIRLVASPLFLWAAYHRPGFPADDAGFSTGDRMIYGSYGLDYLSNAANSRYLAELTVDGEVLFTEAEVSHMTDVKIVVLIALAAGLVLLLLSVIFGLMLRRWRPGGFARGVFAGAWVALALVIALAVVAVLAWEELFDAFHRLLFAEGTWTFAQDDTLIRLYPEQFWMDAGIAVLALVVLMALIALIITWPTKTRRARRRQRLEEVYAVRREKLVEELNRDAEYSDGRYPEGEYVQARHDEVRTGPHAESHTGSHAESHSGAPRDARARGGV